jgi:hypothetical protein
MQSTYNFGAGRVFLHDGSTPREVAVLRDVSVEFSSTQKELRGSKTFPLAMATAAQKVSGKASSGTFDGSLISAILGATVTTGQKIEVTETVAASATVTVGHAATFVTDLGVYDSTGERMKEVASNPTVGQYAVNEGTGVYTFAAGQTGNVSITYRYTVTTGNTGTLINKTQAAPATFKVFLSNDFNGTKGLTLFAVVIPKLALSMKGEEWNETGIDFEAFADASGNVAEISF